MGRIRKEILKTPTPLTTMNVWMYLLSIMDFGGEIDCRIHTVAVMADETGIRRNNFTTSVNHLREIGALRVEKNSEARNAKFRSLYIM